MPKNKTISRVMKRNEFNAYLQDKNFSGFFNELGWDNVPANLRINPIAIDDKQYKIKPVADKQGFKALICHTDEIPQHTVRRKLDFQVRKYFYNYILIFIKENTQHQLWMVPIKTVEKRDLVVLEYETAEKADFLFSKLDNFSFDLDEEVTIVDVTQRVHGAFEINSEKVTKDFYAGFKKQHIAFVRFVEGITVEGDRQWYASVMLNRLMFCYFIQKKGFLNFDTDYLRNKLAWTKEQQGEDQFFGSFYKGFLMALFHGGLNSPAHDNDFRQKYGRIPYLNGGLFDVHQLEEDYADIDIPDKAFEDLFDFFDKWRWHLDTRIEATGKDINPDVLGYIFEQYINDRAQKGAYYTKEDITEYISKNCILPFLMDEIAKTASKKHFTPGGYIWETLRNSGDRYIYDAVKKGTDIQELPEEIAVGLNTDEPNLLERRKYWNLRTPEEYALPTEIWRETIERRNRYFELLNKIRSGEITQINDFITYNLDIRLFVEDLLMNTDDHLLILHFYKALQGVTILDPTCGSGAFLFAALNILEPLYETCINRMQEFNKENPSLFKEQLDEIDQKYRSNIQYFIYKSIILRNLYGVDIMHEATEIARLRLFLKMVAVVDVNHRAENLGLDPLPDIDFNIRCGNTLIGYSTQQELDNDLNYGDMFANMEFKEKINEEMQKVALAYNRFKEIQLSQHEDMQSFKTAKTELNNRLNKLNDTLNRRLYASTVTGNTLSYEAWLASHQPFHWLAEFYEIMQEKEGFDVIIGNPPYISYTKKNKDTGLSIEDNYKLKGYSTLSSNNLFAFIIERIINFTHKTSVVGMIIPLSGVSIDSFSPLERIINNQGISWHSFYSGDRNPSELFNGVKIRANIFILKNYEQTYRFVSKYQKWYSIERKFLFSKIEYVEYNNSTLNSPKMHTQIEKNILSKLSNFQKQLGHQLCGNQSFYYHAAPISWCKGLLSLKELIKRKLNIADSYKEIAISKEYKSFSFLLSNSSLFFLYWLWMSDCYNLTRKYYEEFRIPEIDVNDIERLNSLATIVNNALISKMEIAKYCYKNKGTVVFAQFYPSRLKSIIDEIDKALAQLYGFTEEELDFIINYDIKYRMGSELNAEEEE